MDKNLNKKIKSPDFWVSDYSDAIENGQLNTLNLEGPFWQKSIQYGKFESLITKYPDSAERGIRFNRIFTKPLLWKKIRPVCERHLGQFVQDCDNVATLRQQAEECVGKHRNLLSNISAETLVIHFAYWLEKKYFDASDEFVFLGSIIDYRNVLQKCLMLLPEKPSLEQDEIEAIRNKYRSQILGDGKLNCETTQLFEAVYQWLRVDFFEEMFCSQGWMVISQDTVVTVVPTSGKQFEEVDLPRWKSRISDIFEFELSLNRQDDDYKQEVLEKACNLQDAELLWYFYKGERFLKRYFGDAVLEKVKCQLGVEPVNLLRTLLGAVACYRKLYVEPRVNYKEGYGMDFLSVIDREEVNQLGPSVEPCDFSFFVRLMNAFFKGFVPDAESRVAFNAVTGGIYEKDTKGKRVVDIEKWKNFLVLKNERCYLFMPRLFFSYIYVFQIIFDMLFEKNNKEVSGRLEHQVADLFMRKKFSVFRNYKLKKEKSGADEGELGEIDVLAFRDNTLFIIEVKMVKSRLLVHNIRSIPDTFQKAGDQLDVVLSNLPEHWPTISRELNISVPYESVKKVTMIVSNSFEYDHQYFNDHLKISWHELESVIDVRSPRIIFDLKHRVQPEFSRSLLFEGPVVLDQYGFFSDDNPSVGQMLHCVENSGYWQLVLGRSIRPTPFLLDKFCGI